MKRWGTRQHPQSGSELLQAISYYLNDTQLPTLNADAPLISPSFFLYTSGNICRPQLDLQLVWSQPVSCWFPGKNRKKDQLRIYFKNNEHKVIVGFVLLWHNNISQQFVFWAGFRKTSNICAKFNTDHFMSNLCDKKWLHLAPRGLVSSGFSSCVNPIRAGCMPGVCFHWLTQRWCGHLPVPPVSDDSQ